MPTETIKGLPELKSDRRCGNCGCFSQVPHPENPLEKLTVCLRGEAVPRTIEVPVQATDRNGKPRVDREGQPIMTMGKMTALAYRPMVADSVCYDGWRPADALPGDTQGTYLSRRMAKALEPFLRSSAPDPRKMLNSLLEAMQLPDSAPDSAGVSAASEGANHGETH